MKLVMIISFLLLFKASVLCQQINPIPSLSKQDYLKKSKSQKTGAWVLLGAGVAVLAITTINAASSVDLTSTTDESHSFGIGLAAVMAVSSIPLFIASSRNKRKSTMAASVKIEHASIGGYDLTRINYPAISVRLVLH